MELLYEMDAKGQSAAEVMAALPLAPDRFTSTVVAGVEEHGEAIDALLRKLVRDWPLERLATIDRTVLRMATFELMEQPDIPTAVVLSEAVDMAKRFSTDDSGRFVNGVLAAIAREVRPGG